VRAGLLRHAQGDPEPKGSRRGSSLVRGFVTGMGEENEGRAAQCRASRCVSAIVVSAQGSPMPSTTKSPTRSSLRRNGWHRRDRRRAAARR
jgi:hypothetical protein